MAFPDDWGRKVAITFDKDKVPSTQTDKTCTLTEACLPSEMFDADGSYPAKSGGGDIRFSSDAAGTTELAREIVVFTIDNNPALGKAHVEVKVPSLSSVTSTVIYCWYNNPSATEPASDSTYGRENAWNSNHLGVWHLQESGDGTTDEFLESTSYSNDGTGGGGTTSKTPTQVDAVIAKGQQGDGTDDYIDCTTASTYHFNRNATYSTSTWINFDALGSYDMVISRIVNGSTFAGWEVYKRDDNKIEWQNIHSWATANRLVVYTTNPIPSATTWYHLVTTYDGTSLPSGIKIYLNGVSQALTTRYNNLSVDLTDQVRPLMLIGREVSGVQWNPLDGKFDEVKIHSNVLSQDWITTDYNNQLDPSTFASSGTPESVGGYITGSVRII